MEEDAAAGGFDEAQQEARDGALAGAGFADEAEGFATHDVERDAVDDARGAEVFDEVAGFEQGFGGHAAPEARVPQGATSMLAGEGGGVVANDLPAGGCALDDEEEVAVGVATAGCGALEMEVSGDGGEVGVERLHGELREAERAHGGAGGVSRLVASEHLRVAVLDGAAHEEDVGGVLVAGGEGVDVAAVPVVGGFVEDGDDGLGFGGGGGLRRGERACRGEATRAGDS